MILCEPSVALSDIYAIFVCCSFKQSYTTHTENSQHFSLKSNPVYRLTFQRSIQLNFFMYLPMASASFPFSCNMLPAA